ncbi:MAG TPA: FAD-dependent oxidoreductase [Rectinemataceae bacterium]|nr:FAD-dependent oxidoreductase [Rectinemataceae bacterium]
MSKFRYLIVGAGMAGAAAAQAILEHDPAATLGILGEESDPPYDRPPLSKGLWKGDDPDKIWKRVDGAKFFLGQKAIRIDRTSHAVVCDNHEAIGYERLLLATGGRPRRLDFADPQVVYLRSLADYRRLRSLAAAARRIAVVGGGFIGSEIAAALAMNKKAVTLICPEQGIGAAIFPVDLSTHLNRYFGTHGVTVLPGERAVALLKEGDRRFLHTSSGTRVETDLVVAGIGLEPNVELALEAGLPTHDGVLVDELLRTEDPDIFAAGDVARFYSPALGKRLRLEHEDNALAMGGTAGRNMTGAAELYTHLPLFYSDLFDLGYEAVGELDPRLETVADWKKPFEEGIVYYLAEGRVRGVLLWNAWKRTEKARALVADPGPFDAANVMGRIP